MTSVGAFLRSVDKVAGYRAPAGELAGVRTFISEKPAKGIQDSSGDTINHPPGESPKSDRERALPQRTDTKENLTTYMNSPSYNTPSSSGEGSKVPIRTPGTPGEEYEHPYKENVYPRRTGSGVVPSYSERQQDQKGDAKKYYKRYYRENKGKIRMRAKRRYRKVKRNPEFLRKQDRRDDPKYEDKFHRLPSGGVRSPADRSKDYREDKHGCFDRPLSFIIPGKGLGRICAWDVPWVEYVFEGCWGRVDLLRFLDVVTFLSLEDLEMFFAMVDETMVDPPDPIKVANFYYEKFTPGFNMDPGDGVRDLGLPGPYSPSLTYPEVGRHKPSEAFNNIREIDNNPGSAKVIPEGHDFENKKASTQRVAMRYSEIVRGLGDGIYEGSKGLSSTLRFTNPQDLLHVYEVLGDSGKTYKVSIQGNLDSDVRVSCTCDFWRWQGPEHWAKVNGYLYGEPTGTATKPTKKDPNGVNRVCKHVLSCLGAR